MQKKISKNAEEFFFADTSLAKAHIGICLFDAGKQEFLYNYQSNKYFIPASNTKIFTCYAAMKYLGDSLIAANIFANRFNTACIPFWRPNFFAYRFCAAAFAKSLAAKFSGNTCRYRME